MESQFDENFWEAVNTECHKDILGAVMDFKYERITASELMDYIAFRCEISARLAIDKKGQP